LICEPLSFAMLLMRRGLLAVGDPKRGKIQEVSTKSGEICGSLAGTDPHCSTWGRESRGLVYAETSTAPPTRLLPEGQGGGLEPQHSLCQLPSCGRILLP